MATSAVAAALPNGQAGTRNDWLVIGTSSLGTVFEWYDFYLYGLVASILSTQFFAGVNEVTGYIFALAAFAAGFAVRPFGALVFGRLGDLVGRKHTFLVTMSIMGGATFAVGLLAELCVGRCRRTCTAGQARVIHELDPDNGSPRAVFGAVGGARYAHLYR